MRSIIIVMQTRKVHKCEIRCVLHRRLFFISDSFKAKKLLQHGLYKNHICCWSWQCSLMACRNPLHSSRLFPNALLLWNAGLYFRASLMFHKSFYCIDYSFLPLSQLCTFLFGRLRSAYFDDICFFFCLTLPRPDILVVIFMTIVS